MTRWLGLVIGRAMKRWRSNAGLAERLRTLAAETQAEIARLHAETEAIKAANAKKRALLAKMREQNDYDEQFLGIVSGLRAERTAGIQRGWDAGHAIAKCPNCVPLGELAWFDLDANGRTCPRCGRYHLEA